MKIARQEIILFADSDVILYPDYVEKIVETFGRRPEAVGVAGWIVGSAPVRGIARACARRDVLNQDLRKLFMLFHSSRDSCGYFEYPSILTRIICCSWLTGSSSACKRSIFDELAFDENLKQFSYVEDSLFSSLIQKKYPRRLLMTPAARLIHKKAKEGREIPAKLGQVKLRNRKYVLTKLWGSRGLLMFGWQNLGLWIFRIVGRIRGWSASALPVQQ